MKKFLTSLLCLLIAVTALAQGLSPMEQLKADPRKSYGNDYPYKSQAGINSSFNIKKKDCRLAVFLLFYDQGIYRSNAA